jgi:hypothetical protein
MSAGRHRAASTGGQPLRPRTAQPCPPCGWPLKSKKVPAGAKPFTLALFSAPFDPALRWLLAVRLHFRHIPHFSA